MSIQQDMIRMFDGRFNAKCMKAPTKHVGSWCPKSSAGFNSRTYRGCHFNRGSPKASTSMGLSLIKRPFFGYLYFKKPQRASQRSPRSTAQPGRGGERWGCDCWRRNWRTTSWLSTSWTCSKQRTKKTSRGRKRWRQGIHDLKML